MPTTDDLEESRRRFLARVTALAGAAGATQAHEAGNSVAREHTSGGAGSSNWPATPKEKGLGVVPENIAFPPGHVARYGAAGDGITDDSDAINTAIRVSNIVHFEGQRIYFCERPLEVGGDAEKRTIELNDATLDAEFAIAGTLDQFTLRNGVLRSQGRRSYSYFLSFRVKDGQQMRNVTLENLDVDLSNLSGRKTSRRAIWVYADGPTAALRNFTVTRCRFTGGDARENTDVLLINWHDGRAGASDSIGVRRDAQGRVYNVTVHSCVFENIHGRRVQLLGIGKVRPGRATDDSALELVQNVAITNNTVRNIYCQDGALFNVQGSALQICGNWLSNTHLPWLEGASRGTGIYTKAKYAQVHHNLLWDVGGEAAILLKGSGAAHSSRCIAAHNMIIVERAEVKAALDAGICLHVERGATAKGNWIEDRTNVGALTKGIALGRSNKEEHVSTHLRVLENEVVGVDRGVSLFQEPLFPRKVVIEGNRFTECKQDIDERYRGQDPQELSLHGNTSDSRRRTNARTRATLTVNVPAGASSATAEVGTAVFTSTSEHPIAVLSIVPLGPSAGAMWVSEELSEQLTVSLEAPAAAPLKLRLLIVSPYDSGA